MQNRCKANIVIDFNFRNFASGRVQFVARMLSSVEKFSIVEFFVPTFQQNLLIKSFRKIICQLLIWMKQSNISRRIFPKRGMLLLKGWLALSHLKGLMSTGRFDVFFRIIHLCSVFKTHQLGFQLFLDFFFSSVKISS